MNLQARILDMKPRLRAALTYKRLVIAYYVAVGWVTVADLGYGLALKRWPAEAAQAHITSEGGRQAEGRLEKLSARGFGRHRDYFIRVEGKSEDYQLPAGMAQDWVPGSSGPDYDLTSRMSVGDTVRVATLGGARPIIVELARKGPDGSWNAVIERSVVGARFDRLSRSAPLIGEEVISFALRLPILAGLAHLFFWVVRRSYLGRSRRTAS